MINKDLIESCKISSKWKNYLVPNAYGKVWDCISIKKLELQAEIDRLISVERELRKVFGKCEWNEEQKELYYNVVVKNVGILIELQNKRFNRVAEWIKEVEAKKLLHVNDDDKIFGDDGEIITYE
jgi:hypothetical protein